METLVFGRYYVVLNAADLFALTTSPLLHERFVCRSEYVAPALRLCVSSAKFADVANVTYPDVFDKFLQLFDLFNLDFGFWLSAGCLWTNIDFHYRLLMSTLWPLGALVVLYFTYRFAYKKANTRFGAASRAADRVYDAHVSAVLWLTFLVYSTVSSTLFQTWACEQLDDGGDYLRADYTIQCTSTKHHIFLPSRGNLSQERARLGWEESDTTATLLFRQPNVPDHTQLG